MPVMGVADTLAPRIRTEREDPTVELASTVT